MNCRDCIEAQELDGLVPDCQTEDGCKIPRLHPAAARAMEIRDKLIRLHRLKIGPAILDRYQATVEDLELLALAEDELTTKEATTDGDGSEMGTEC